MCSQLVWCDGLVVGAGTDSVDDTGQHRVIFRKTRTLAVHASGSFTVTGRRTIFNENIHANIRELPIIGIPIISEYGIGVPLLA